MDMKVLIIQLRRTIPMCHQTTTAQSSHRSKEHPKAGPASTANSCAHFGQEGMVLKFKFSKLSAHIPANLTSFLNTSLLFLASSLEVSASAVLGFFEV